MREHIIADQSVNYVERFIIDEGHVVHRVQSDYGYDLFMETFDEHGYLERSLVMLQLKASESLTAVRDSYVFDVDIRDYNVWIEEQSPVVLILFDASRRKAYWLCIQQYFAEDTERLPKEGAKTVRVRIPMRQTISRRAIAKMRTLKRDFVATKLKR